MIVSDSLAQLQAMSSLTSKIVNSVVHLLYKIEIKISKSFLIPLEHPKQLINASTRNLGMLGLAIMTILESSSLLETT